MRHLSWKILIAKRTAITPVIGEIGYVVILFFWLEFFGALAEVDGTGCVSFSAGHFARLDLSERRRSRFPIDHSHPRKGTCYAKGTMLRMASSTDMEGTEKASDKSQWKLRPQRLFLAILFSH